METKKIAVSGTVGVQAFSSNTPVLLHGFLLTPLSANARVTIRDGNASGEIKYEQSVLANSSAPVILPCPHRFDKGMHVKVIGSNAVCYLLIE